MLPGKGMLKANHKTKPIKGVSALKTAVLFGANAAGKSNLIKAIEFGKKTLLEGTKSEQPINFQGFKLDKKSTNQNSYIEYEIQHKNKNYAYGFVFNSKEIVDEWLFEIGKTSEKKIFERKNTTNFDLEYLSKKNTKKEEKQFLEFTAKGTPRNQLFLTQVRNTNIIDNITDISDILNVIDWFQNTLTVIYPSSKNISTKFELLENINLKKLFTEMLDYFDTGIDGISFKQLDFDKIHLPNEVKEDIKKDLLSKKSDKNNIFYQIFMTINIMCFQKHLKMKLKLKFLKQNIKSKEEHMNFLILRMNLMVQEELWI